MPEPGQNKPHSVHWRCRVQPAPRSPRGSPVLPHHDLRKAGIRQVPSRVPGAGSAQGCVYMSPCRPTSVFMCVFPYGCVWLRVCGGVSGCVRVSLRVGLSVNLLENENKPGSLAAVPEPRSSAASRQTVTAGLMTEHTHASLRAFLIAPSDILKQRKLKTKLIAASMSREQREAGGSLGGWELAAGREKGIRSRWSRGQATRLGQSSAESWVGIGSAADPGRGLGTLQHRRAGWPRWISHGNLCRILPGPRIFFFPLSLPRFSLSSSSDSLQLPARERCSKRLERGGRRGATLSQWAHGW